MNIALGCAIALTAGMTGAILAEKDAIGLIGVLVVAILIAVLQDTNS
jgi:hypothetical protein